jgi:hypothetical protein
MHPADGHLAGQPDGDVLTGETDPRPELGAIEVVVRTEAVLNLDDLADRIGDHAP